MLFETCTIKGKRICNPIVDWLDRDIWDYIQSERIPVNLLYEWGFHRVHWLPHGGKEPLDRIPHFSQLQEGLFTGIRHDDDIYSGAGDNNPMEGCRGCLCLVDGG